MVTDTTGSGKLIVSSGATLDARNIFLQGSSIVEISGSDVTIKGTLTPKDSANLRIQYNEDIKVSEFTVANQETFQRSLQRILSTLYGQFKRKN